MDGAGQVFGDLQSTEALPLHDSHEWLDDDRSLYYGADNPLDIAAPTQGDAPVHSISESPYFSRAHDIAALPVSHLQPQHKPVVYEVGPGQLTSILGSSVDKTVAQAHCERVPNGDRSCASSLGCTVVPSLQRMPYTGAHAARMPVHMLHPQQLGTMFCGLEIPQLRPEAGAKLLDSHCLGVRAALTSHPPDNDGDCAPSAREHLSDDPLMHPLPQLDTGSPFFISDHAAAPVSAAHDPECQSPNTPAGFLQQAALWPDFGQHCRATAHDSCNSLRGPEGNTDACELSPTVGSGAGVKCCPQMQDSATISRCNPQGGTMASLGQAGHTARKQTCTIKKATAPSAVQSQSPSIALAQPDADVPHALVSGAFPGTGSLQGTFLTEINDSTTCCSIPNSSMADVPEGTTFKPSTHRLDSTSVALDQEHSLQRLHSTLCTVGGARQELDHVPSMQNNGKKSHASGSAASFRPVMIPSDPTSFPQDASRDKSYAMHAFVHPMLEKPVYNAAVSVPSNANSWQYTQRGQPEDGHSFSPMQLCTARHVPSGGTFQNVPSHLSGSRLEHHIYPPSLSSPMRIPGMHSRFRDEQGEPCFGVNAMQAPGSVQTRAILHGATGERIHGVSVHTARAAAAHEGTVRGGRALQAQMLADRHGTVESTCLSASLGARDNFNGKAEYGSGSKRTAKTLSEMVAAADAVSVPDSRFYQSATVCTDTSLHSSSKRTRTSTGTTLLADSCIMDGATNSTHTIQTTGLTGSMEQVHVSDPGASSHGGRSRRSRLGLDPKEEHTIEDWVSLIAREEAAGDAAKELALREEFLQWEIRSKAAPNGKWRGANSRKWGKVGIEMRLTGAVPRTNGPQTLLGKMVCKFVDIVELQTSPFCGKPKASRNPMHLYQANATSHQDDCVNGSPSRTPVPLRSSISGADLEHPLPSQSPHYDTVATAVPQSEECVWRLSEVVDKQNGGNVKTVLKEKVWLGTYHTPINAAVHHDFYKVVLAVEGCIYTSVDVPSCSTPTGKKKSQKLKLNFALADLPELMFKAVRFTQLWNKYKQDAERYVFRAHSPHSVRKLVQHLIDVHCCELRKHVANTEAEGGVGTVERRSTRTRSTVARDYEDPVD